MESIRTCVGCFSRAHQSELVRVVVSCAALVVDDTGTLPGRGAWIHRDKRCQENALKRRAFYRALRLDSPLDETNFVSVFPNCKPEGKNRTEKTVTLDE